MTSISNTNTLTAIPTTEPSEPNDRQLRFEFPTGKANIKWDNFNYPPFLKLIHYDPKELDGPLKVLIKRLNWTFRLMIIVGILNFINCIAQTAAGLGGLRILYSILNMLVFWPLSLFAFYKGYRGLTYNKSEFKMYWIVQFVLGCACVIFSIISGANYNGWVRVVYLFEHNYIFQGLLAIFESLIYELNAILILYCLWKIRRFSNQNPGSVDRL